MLVVGASRSPPVQAIKGRCGLLCGPCWTRARAWGQQQAPVAVGEGPVVGGSTWPDVATAPGLCP